MKASLHYKYITSVKNGKQYVVFDYKDGTGKRKRKWVTTGLPEKCTKKALNEAIDEIISEFDAQFRSSATGSATTVTPMMTEQFPATAGTPESGMTMREYISNWLTAVRPNLARTTYSTYSRINERFVNYLDINYPNITLGELRYNHIQEFLNQKLAEGCKGSAVNSTTLQFTLVLPMRSKWNTFRHILWTNLLCRELTSTRLLFTTVTN